MDKQPQLFEGDVYRVDFGKQDEITVGNSRRTVFDPHRLDWVPWGPDNLHPDKFLAYYSTNSTYEAVVRKNAQLVKGDRIEFEGTPAEVRGFEAFLAEHDPNGDVLARLARDLAMFQGCAAYIVPSTRGQNSVAKLKAVDFANIRSGVVSMESHDVECVYYSPDWSVVNSMGKVYGRVRKGWRDYYKPIKYPLWGYNQGREAYMMTAMALPPAGKYYPNPIGSAAMNEIELVYRNIELQLKQLENGMFTQMRITIPYQPINNSEEDRKNKERIVQRYKDQFTGSQQAGTAFIEFATPQQLESGAVTKIEKLDTSMEDRRYIETNRLVNESIMTNLGVVAPELYGISKGTGFSSEADKLEVAMRLQIDAIKPQQQLLSRMLKKIANAAGYGITDCYIETDMPNIRDLQTVGIDESKNDTQSPAEDGN